MNTLYKEIEYPNIPESEGWFISDSSGSVDGSWQIQKNDEMGLFEDDIDVINMVYKRAMENDILCKQVLAFIAFHNPKELRYIKYENITF